MADLTPREQRHAFIERYSRWIMEAHERVCGAALVNQAREFTTLDGVYRGKSKRIHALVRLAYLRGVRCGVGAVWEAHQKIGLRAD